MDENEDETLSERHDNPPADLAEDEIEIYALLGALRQQVIELVDDFAEVIVGRVERRQREMERLESPAPGEMASEGGSDFLNVITRLLGISESRERSETGSGEEE